MRTLLIFDFATLEKRSNRFIDKTVEEGLRKA